MENEWKRVGDLPSDDKMDKMGDILGGVLAFVAHSLREEGIMTEDSFYAASIVVKFELEHDGESVAAVATMPDEPLIALSLMQQGVEHVTEVLVQQGGIKREDMNGQG